MSTTSPIPTLSPPIPRAQRQEPMQLQSLHTNNNDNNSGNNNNRSSLVCVTCHSTGSLRDSKLGNYTTDKFNAIYRELFPLFNGVDGSICGSCYKKCYHERLRRGMFQKRERANLVNAMTTATGKRKPINNTAATETEISTTMTMSAATTTGGNLSNETNMDMGMEMGMDLGMDLGTEDTRSRKKRKVTLLSGQPKEQYTEQQQQTEQQQRQQPMRKRRRSRTSIVPSSSGSTENRQRMDSELSYHEEEDIEEDEQSDSSDESMVEVYFDFRLLSPRDERNHNPRRFNSVNHASARPMKIIKSSIASQIPGTALKREAKFEMKESFEGKYKIMDIKLYEKDASGTIIEVDLIDDEFFMTTPVEYRTRFIIYVSAQTSKYP